MFDIGFWEILIIAVVLLLVMGPERLPEVAKQAAFLVRKARQGMFRLRSEMKTELDGTPFADLKKAKQEMSEFKNDMKQFGRDLADSAEDKINIDEAGKTKPSAAEPLAKEPVAKEPVAKEPVAKKKPSAKIQSSSKASK